MTNLSMMISKFNASDNESNLKFTNISFGMFDVKEVD